jgi:hypothetical protein
MDSPAFLEGFHDHMEKLQPGYKAERAAFETRRDQERAAFVSTMSARHGSVDAAMEPCEKEAALRRAFGDRLVSDPEGKPDGRWTQTLDGWYGFLFDAPESVRATIAAALPLPATMAEAKAELDYWHHREEEMEACLGWQFGDAALDLPAALRLHLVQDLYETDIPARDFGELLERSRYAQGRDHACNERIARALHRDLEALVASLPR